MAVQWLGEAMPQWRLPCPIQVTIATGNGGATSFVFDHGEVGSWNMNIQGSKERLIDSVLPHEVTHTVFASYFREAIPRWADEGACTTVEHPAEIRKMQVGLVEYLRTGRGIPFDTMLAMQEYPKDVMPLYAQGWSVSNWLIQKKGRKEFMLFLKDGLTDDNWRRAIASHYGYRSVTEMQNAWLENVKGGMK